MDRRILSRLHGEVETFRLQKSESQRKDGKPKLIYHDFIMKFSTTQVSFWPSVELFFN